MPTLREQAVARVEGFLKSYDEQDVAELLADVLHYCESKAPDLWYCNVLDQARAYVDEELSFDEEYKNA